MILLKMITIPTDASLRIIDLKSKQKRELGRDLQSLSCVVICPE